MNLLTNLLPPNPDETHPGTRRSAMLRYLHDLGHFHERDAHNFVVEQRPWSDVNCLEEDHQDVLAAVASWQKMREGIVKHDGHFGPFCAHAAFAEMPCRCGHPDIMERRVEQGRWPDPCKGNITVAQNLDGMRYSGRGSPLEARERAIAGWNGVCGVHMRMVDSKDKARIWTELGSMSRGILAWSYLPNNNCAERLLQNFNRLVNWTFDFLWEVDTHEDGHALGLGHGGVGAMRPSVTGNLDESNAFDPWILRQVLSWYGEPIPTPDPPGPPGPPPGEEDPRTFSGILTNKLDEQVDVIIRRREVPDV